MAELATLLEEQASAPRCGFDRFMVGRPHLYRRGLIRLLEDMISDKKPSTIRVILGPNGNGKTLINNALQEAATKINKKDNLSFKVLFSRISIADPTGSDLGLRLANGLTRSIHEDPSTTFTLISAQTLKRFSSSYKPPLWRRIVPGLARGLLRKLQKGYDDYARDVLDLGEADPVEKGLDHIEDTIRRILTDRSMHKAFSEYASRREMGSVLTKFLMSRGRRALSVKALNEALREELINQQHGLNPKHAVHALATIAREVECRVLVFMLDDCNTEPGQDYVLNLAESLGEFHSPKLLVIASGLKTAWDQRIQDDGEDHSFEQKVLIFGQPRYVAAPTDDELRQLSHRLMELVVAESSAYGGLPDWDEADKANVLAKCKGKSYREATLLLLKEIRKHVEGDS